MSRMKTAISVPYLRHTLRTIGSAKIIESGSNARIYCAKEIVPALLLRLKKIGSKTHSFDVYPSNELPAVWKDRNIRNGQLLLVAHPHYYFEPKGPSETLLVDVHKKSLGKHGYPPSLPDMKALFIAHGPDFPPRKKSVHLQMTEVAPLVLSLLGQAQQNR